MDFDFTRIAAQDRYRLLTNFIGPRPIALVSTLSEGGQDNAAPMSFFNVFSHDPAIVILGIQTKPDGQEKDTVRNIRRNREFVVNMVDMAIADAMLDRLMQNHHRFTLTGESLRKKNPPAKGKIDN